MNKRIRRWARCVGLVAILNGAYDPSIVRAAEPLAERDRLIWAAVLDELRKAQDPEDELGLSSGWAQIIGLTLMEAKDKPQVRTLKAYRYIGETARTDKQVGSSAASIGTTSLLTKPGLPALLALAIEHGAIEQAQSGTNINLRSSPAMLFKALYRSRDGEAPEDHPTYPWLSRVGVSATLPFDDNISTSRGNTDLSEVTDWAVQANLNFWPDRTVHSARFQTMWDTKVAPLIIKRLNDQTAAVSVVGDYPEITQASRRALAASRAAIAPIIATNRTLVDSLTFPTTESDAIARLRQGPVYQAMFTAIATALNVEIVEPVRSGDLDVPDAALRTLEAAYKDLVDVHAAIAKIKEDLLDKEFQKILAVPVFTAEYSNHKPPVGSNYSEAKLLLQYRLDVPLVLFPEPFDLIANANASFYHDPDKALGEDSVRDYGFSVGAEFRFDNPFAGFIGRGDLSPITLLVAGRFARMESQADEAGYGQAKLSIPLIAGLSIPLSVTYATRTEDNKEDEVRGNFGFTFDLDKLYALAALARLR